MLKGLPGSGKSTWARSQMIDRPLNDELTIVTKDDIRRELGGWSQEREKEVQRIRDSRIANALYHGHTVISADTNFARGHKLRLAQLARQNGAAFEVKKFVVPVEECIRRDAQRAGDEHVGRGVIERMVKDYHLDTDPEWYGPQPTIVRYAPIARLPWAAICDLDGTLALPGDRDPYDESSCEHDAVNLPVLATLIGLHRMAYQILYTSARREQYREQTLRFLRMHNAPPGELFMRATGDTRKDWVVKGELFDANIRDKYNILLVLDDRNQVVQYWRSLGLTVFQVAEGDF